MSATLNKHKESHHRPPLSTFIMILLATSIHTTPVTLNSGYLVVSVGNGNYNIYAKPMLYSNETIIGSCSAFQTFTCNSITDCKFYSPTIADQVTTLEYNMTGVLASANLAVLGGSEVFWGSKEDINVTYAQNCYSPSISADGGQVLEGSIDSP